LKAQAPKPGDTRVTLVAKKIRIADIFNAIWDQTGYQAFYNDEQLSSAERLNVKFRNDRLNKVLRFLLKKRHLTWYFREETFVIMPAKEGDNTDEDEDPDIDRLNIQGMVTNPGNMPIPGATVLVKGARRGVTTDETGAFTLTVDKTATLVVSSMGYNPKEIPLEEENSEHLNVRLSPAVTGLNEVVIIAYGSAIRRDLTGSVSRVTAADIAQQPVSNPLQAMQGRIMGLDIMPVSGLPGSDFKVALRGRNSISSGNNPLYIIDGVPLTATPLTWSLSDNAGLGANNASSPLNLININDIESIDVLKDADATAIYGSRGANGVVLVTTKKGRRGEAQAGVNVYTGIGQAAHQVPYLNNAQYLQMRREAFRNDGAVPGPSDYDMHWDSTRYTNWQQEMIGGTSHITDVQGAVTGGSENALYAVRGGYRRETTVYPGDFAYRKATVSIHATFTTRDPGKRGKAVLMAAYTGDRNQLPAIDLAALSNTPPNSPPVYNRFGGINWQNNTFDNPYASLLRRYTANGSNLLAGAVLSYQVLKPLQLITSFGYTHMQMDEMQVNPLSSLNPASAATEGYSYFASGNLRSWIMEPQLVFKDTLWNNGIITTLAGATFQQDVRSQQCFLGTGYASDVLLEDLTAAGTITPMGVVNTKYRYTALFGRINFAWQHKYIVNLTGRRDGSSRFGPGNRFANFGAAGLAWIFSEEAWLKNSHVLSFGKLRGSYGITGNDQITDYGYLETYSSAPVYQGARGLYASRLYNPSYGWGQNVKLEAALELGFLENRILVTVNRYHNRSSNQLVSYTLPGTTGFDNVRRNLPAIVDNTGWEFDISADIIKSENLTWTNSLNMSIPRNKLVSFPGIETSGYNNTYTTGQPLNIFRGAQLEAVDPATGVYRFRDLDGDKNFSFPADYIYTKRTGTLLYGGWQHRLQYKRWQLDVLFYFVQQQRYNYLYTNSLTAPGGPVNLPAAMLDRWQQPGRQTGIQRFTQDPASPAGMAYSYALNSDQTITGASFIRCKSLNIAYQLPARWLQRLRIKDSRFFIQAQNLFTITGYKGVDPETAAQAIIYPPLRVCTMGLRLSFY
jgi:TonB-linked SusC/RagA family outer membrane protein